MASIPKVSKEDKKREDEYRAKDDARTLTDAEAIHDDHNRLMGAHKHLMHSRDALHKVIKRINRRVSRR